MPDPAGTFQDGGVIYGSQKVSMKNEAGTNEIYVLKNITVDRPVKELTRMNEFGVPDGQVFIDDKVRGSATGQFSTSTSKPPKRFEEFALTKVGGGTETFFVKSVSINFGQDAETTFTIEFTKKLAA
jgi:hypothetical protein